MAAWMVFHLIRKLWSVCAEIARDQKDDDVMKTLWVFRQMRAEDPGFQFSVDFDEDKRSCRRKLERHNKRRRRKPDSKGTLDKEIDDQLDLSADVSGDGELREGDTIQSLQIC